MSWVIGSITLPKKPQTVKCKPAQDVKGIPQYIKSPLLLCYGPKTRVLSLDGWIAEVGKTMADLETDYLIPLRDITEKKMRFPYLVADDDQATFWSKLETVGTLVLTDETDATKVARGENSLKWAITPSVDTSDVSIYKDYSPGLDLSAHDFISVWIYGNATVGGNFYLYFRTDGSNYFSKMFTGLLSEMKRFIVRKDEFGITGSPDWSNITRIEMRHTQTGYSSPFNIWTDRKVVGVGVLVDGPETRHDGIYVLQSFPWDEKKGYASAVPYKMILWFVDDYY